MTAPIQFLAPGAFLLGLLLPVIIAFYLLKLRRVEQPVPSVYLWRRMVRDVEANAPWQRLRYNLLMILQLLFLAFLILALARPFSLADGPSGQSAILIVDTSASMSAVDMAPTRLEAAKQRARQFVDDLPDSARITIIEAGREAIVRLSSSLDRRQAHLAIESMQAGTGGSDMSVALELASAIAARQPGTEIMVLSDGRVTLPERMAVKGQLRYLPFGLNGDNQAISLLTLEPAPGGSSLTAFAQVSNYNDQPASRRMTLFADGQLINAYDLNDIASGGQQSVVAEGLPLTTQVLEARLEGADTLPLDDQAQAVQPSSQPVPVTLISSGNLFLKTALSLLPGVVLNESTPTEPQGTATPGVPTAAPTVEENLSENASGLTIYDGIVPDTLPPTGSLLFIAPPSSTELFTTTGAVESPAIRLLNPEDPLLTHVSLSGVSVMDAISISLPDWAFPVIAGDTSDGSIPLLLRGEVSGRRVAVLAFDLHHSDLPLNVAFPLLWANMIDWLAPGTHSEIPVQVAPGEGLSFTAPNGAQSGQVTRPDGSIVQIQAESGRFVFADTTQLGLYQVRFEGSDATERRAAFIVNLFSPQESSLRPADSLFGLENLNDQNGSGTQQGQREWWRPLALLALGLLMGEWLVYQRAAFARLRDLFLRRLSPEAARKPPFHNRF